MSTTTPEPLVSIVTPTIIGRSEQLGRCEDSVRALDWPSIQHVVVADRDAAIRQAWTTGTGERYREMLIVELNESWRNPTTEASIGAIPWYIGSLLAVGEFVGFCGDDDELLPDHVQRHIQAMRQAEAMFSISAVDFRTDGEHRMVIGPGYELGQLDAIGIMCHIDALRVANWTANGENAADYRLVRDWRQAGLRGVLVEGPPTAVHHDGWLAGKTGRPDRPK